MNLNHEQLCIETDRLIITPLTFQQLQLYVQPGNSLEKHFGLAPHPRTIPEALKEALEELIIPQVGNAENNYLYNTLWTIIHKEQHTMIGDLCFKGPPNADGEIEVGYGTYPDFVQRGFMTEALGGLVNWALSQPMVFAVIAETTTDNIASHKTLERNGFVVYKRADDMLWWRRDSM